MEKKEKKSGMGASGIIALVILIGVYMIFTLFLNTDGSGSGDFNHYAGPVLPMTSLNGAEGVEVQRNVNFDFSPYEKPGDYATLSKGAAGITDTYILTNTTGENRTLELVYGFQGQFIDYAEEFPTITVNGETIPAALYPSVDPESLVWNANHFEKYSEVLRENDFMTIALSAPEIPEQTVTAYHFTDLAYHGDLVAAYPMLTVTFSTAEDTVLWTNMVDSIGTDDETGRHHLMFRVDRGEAWIFAVGGTLNDLEFGGNRDYNIDDKSAIEVEYRMEVFETDFASVLTRFAREYNFWEIEGNTYYPNPGFVTPEILVNGTIKQMGEKDWVENAHNVRTFSGHFHKIITDHRMMYLVFPVEIPAGQTVTVEASYVQEPSYDISGPKKYREGYEMATKLGSDLNFTDLGASLSNTARIEIGKQNFGFDLEQGITDVILDLNVERYYLEVHLKQ